MLKQLGMVNPDNYKNVINYLKENKQRLGFDVSNYARGRERYWLQYQWDLKERCFSPAIKDERLWSWCKTWMPDADLGLVVYGSVGITPHRDDSYADWRAVGINLGHVEAWYYDPVYPELKYTNKKNPSNPQTHKIPPRMVFEFNCKNEHAAIKPHPERWGIFLWKVSNKFKKDFRQVAKSH